MASVNGSEAGFYLINFGVCLAAKADFTPEKNHRSKPFSLVSSRKNYEAALQADRVDLGCFVESHQSQVKRQ